MDSGAARSVAAAHQHAGERPVRFEVGAVGVELRLAHADLIDLPRCLAELCRQRFGVDQAARVGNVGEAEVAVLLPVEIGGEPQQVTNMALALGGGAQVVSDDARGQRSDRKGAADDCAGEGEQCAGLAAGVAPQRRAKRDGQQRRAGGAQQRGTARRCESRLGCEPEVALRLGSGDRVVSVLGHPQVQEMAAASSARAAWAARREAAAKPASPTSSPPA